MQTVDGSLFPVTVAGISFDATRDTRYLELPTQETLTIFRDIAVREADITLNQLGLYSHIPVGRDNRARFARIGVPKHLISSRKNGCVWLPKGGFTHNTDFIPICPYTVQMEECPDALQGDCFERIFGPGNKIQDLLGTAEGAALVQMILSQVMIGIGNSFSELVNFSNHPLIEAANLDGFYDVEEKEWEDYYDQQMSSECAGVVTQMDRFYEDGHPNFSMEIPDSDINQETQEYIGDIVGLFRKLAERAKGPFKTIIRNGMEFRSVGGTVIPNLYRPVNGKIFPIILATRWEFDAYKDYLIATWGTIPDMYRYFLTKQSGGDPMLLPNVLMYDGMPVVNWDEIATFDGIVGSVSHRVAIITPGALQIAHDVDNLNQYSGMGLRVTQKLDDPWGGKMFMSTNFKWGGGLVPDYMVMATNLRHP